ncbi:MAG TPA: tRNA lysidine(34) synthetase TilS [Micromonosporaceae bacterium]
MARLAAPVAATRTAVRDALRGLPRDALVLVACSGGADSLALATATAFVAPRLGLRTGLVSVDHGLQPGSARRAEAVVDWAAKLGFEPAVAVPVRVAGRPGGPEAAARQARYEALFAAAREHRASMVLVGHTRDDQAETVLLALARGAGPRGMAGMAPRSVRDEVILARPFLDVPRATTRAACAELGLTPWDDPHNTDPAYTRSRVRAALPLLVEALGPAVVANLAGTARLLAADTAALDALAERALVEASDPDGALRVADLVGLPDAVRGRVLRLYALRSGASPGALGHRHIDALDALVTSWRGQGPVALPGGRRVRRTEGRLVRVGGPVGDAEPARGEPAGGVVP